MSRFGFKVKHHVPEYDGDYAEGWEVSLPHQCDAWTISAVDAYAPPVSQPEAVARLQAFISEANEALLALHKGLEFP